MEGTTSGDDNGKADAGSQDKTERHDAVSSQSDNGNQDNPGQPNAVSSQRNTVQHSKWSESPPSSLDPSNTAEDHDDGTYSVSDTWKRVETQDMMMHGALQDDPEDPQEDIPEPHDPDYSIQKWASDLEGHTEWVGTAVTPPADRQTSGYQPLLPGSRPDVINPLRESNNADGHKPNKRPGPRSGPPSQRNHSPGGPKQPHFKQMPFLFMPHLPTSEQRRRIRAAVCATCRKDRRVSVSRREDGTV